MITELSVLKKGIVQEMNGCRISYQKIMENLMHETISKAWKLEPTILILELKNFSRAFLASVSTAKLNIAA